MKINVRRPVVWGDFLVVLGLNTIIAAWLSWANGMIMVSAAAIAAGFALGTCAVAIYRHHGAARMSLDQELVLLAAAPQRVACRPAQSLSEHERIALEAIESSLAADPRFVSKFAAQLVHRPEWRTFPWRLSARCGDDVLFTFKTMAWAFTTLVVFITSSVMSGLPLVGLACFAGTVWTALRWLEKRI